MKKIFLLAIIILSFGSAQDLWAQRKNLVGGSGVITVGDTARYQMPDINCDGLLIKNTSAADTLLIGGDNLIKANGFAVSPGESFRVYPIDNMKMVYYKFKNGSGSLNYYYMKP